MQHIIEIPQTASEDVAGRLISTESGLDAVHEVLKNTFGLYMVLRRQEIEFPFFKFNYSYNLPHPSLPQSANHHGRPAYKAIDDILKSPANLEGLRFSFESHLKLKDRYGKCGKLFAEHDPASDEGPFIRYVFMREPFERGELDFGLFVENFLYLAGGNDLEKMFQLPEGIEATVDPLDMFKTRLEVVRHG